MPLLGKFGDAKNQVEGMLGYPLSVPLDGSFSIWMADVNLTSGYCAIGRCILPFSSFLPGTVPYIPRLCPFLTNLGNYG